MATATPWRILVVDDEEGIHGITRMILRDYEFDKRPIELISALSGREAREKLQTFDNIALVLLDVVMECDDEGLRLVNFIRDELENRDMRIILRTGHPGFAPETEVIVDYDINDYLSKAELSASRLLTSVVVALRSYRDIVSARYNQPREAGSLPVTDNPCLSEQLPALVMPLLDNSRRQSLRLQQLDLPPMARSLVEEIQCEQTRLAGLLDQLENRLWPQEAPTDSAPRALLNQLVESLLPFARQRHRLLDSRPAPDLPEQLRYSPLVTLQLWRALLEHAMTIAPDQDLRLNLVYLPEQELLQLRIETSLHTGRDNGDNLRLQFWKSRGRDICSRQAEALGGELELLAVTTDSIMINCSIRATLHE